MHSCSRLPNVITALSLRLGPCVWLIDVSMCLCVCVCVCLFVCVCVCVCVWVRGWRGSPGCPLCVCAVRTRTASSVFNRETVAFLYGAPVLPLTVLCVHGSTQQQGGSRASAVGMIEPRGEYT